MHEVVEPLLDKGIDRIVLGCTHYPFLVPHIERVIAGRDIQIVDSGEAVARRVEWLLERYNLFAERGHKPEFRFITFSTEEYRQRLEDKAFREL